MTLNRVGDGTATFTPPSGLNADVFSLARPPVVAPYQGQLNGARYSVAPVGKDYPGLWHFIVEFYDLRGPIRQQGRFDLVHNANANNTSDLRFEGVATAPFLTTGATSPVIGDNGTFFSIYSAQYGGQTVWSIPNNQSSAHGYLVGETSATDPTVREWSKTAGAPAKWDGGANDVVTGIWSVEMNGIGYLVMSYQNAACDFFSDIAYPSPTLAGAGDTLTKGMYGMVQTTLPNRPIVIMRAAGFYTLAANVAINTAPTLQSAVINQGGFSVGLLGLGGGPVRCWFNTSDITGTNAPGAGANAALDGTYLGKIISVDQFGGNPVTHNTPYSKVVHTAICRGGLVYGDFDGLTYDNGRSQKPLQIFKDEPADSNIVRKVTGIWCPKGQELFAEVNECYQDSATPTVRHIRRYDFDLDHWSRVSVGVSAGTGMYGMQSYIGAGSLPYSNRTGFIHNGFSPNATFAWERKFEPPSGANPWTYRHTSGATAGTGQQFEPVHGVTTVDFDIPGLEGYPKVVTRVIGPPMENIQAGGSDAYVEIAIAGNSETIRFDQQEPSYRYPMAVLSGREALARLQFTITGHQQSSGTDATRYAMNLLPFWAEGYCLKEPDDIPPDWDGIAR